MPSSFDVSAPNKKASSRKKLVIVFVIFLIIAVVIAIAVPLALRHDDDEDEAGEKVLKLDCYPEAAGGVSFSEEDCKRRGCSYDRHPPQGQPACFYSQYKISVAHNVQKTDRGLTATLTQSGISPFGGEIKEWNFTFEKYGDDIARFTFDTANSSRYKVPKKMNLPTGPSPDPQFELKLINDTEQFAFQIIRARTGTVIWDINLGSGSLILSDQFLQITTKLPSTNIYGLGENVHDSFKHQQNKIWPAFSRDQPPSFDDQANLYGVHPFYTCVEDSQGNTHGILMLNSNAQEYALSDLPSLTFRTIGGILDFYVFMGPTPEQVIQQYTGVIGRPVMPPYWSLGFQLCRYGYNNIENLKAAVNSTAFYEIPHDVQYVDIDHMDTQKIFTVDNVRFPGLNDYLQSLQQQGMRIIYILDPCIITNESNYAPYEKMKAIGGNIKWSPQVAAPEESQDSDGSILGYVWPENKVVFPDFLKQKTQREWEKLIVNYRDSLTFDGLWIDMNEPAVFGTNEERPWNWPESRRPYWSLQCPKNAWEDPPYRPKAAYRWDTETVVKRLSDKTLCMSAVQGEQDEYYHYDVHSLYGWSQSETTLRAVREATKERGIVISRSTFPGSGEYVGHWLGDNVSQWKDLKSSIIGMLEFNLFGIPYIGADICGFFGNTTQQLCKRWMQLGAFYTFSRNHNTLGANPQGPGQLGDEVGIASRDILRVRYRLLPYLYYLFHKAHTQGSTVIRPLHHEFPSDGTALGVDTQFMWGSCLLISPILEEDQQELTYYLPKGTWYNFYTYDRAVLSHGKKMEMSVDADTMPQLHLRGGCVIVEQDYANNTQHSRSQPLTVIAALHEGTASGWFFWDDGVSIDTYENGKYYLGEFKAFERNLTLRVEANGAGSTVDSLRLERVLVLGVTATVDEVASVEVAITNYTQTGHVLDLRLNQQVIAPFTIGWSYSSDFL